MAWNGETISGVNALLKNVDIDDIVNYKKFGNPLLARLERNYKHDNLYVGAGMRYSLKTSVPMNARPRADAADVPIPRGHTFDRMTITLVEYIASTGITIKQQEQCKRSKTAVANLADHKLEDLREDMRLRLNTAAKGDGTGRLGVVGSVGTTAFGSPWTVTLGNTSYSFGWPGAEMLEVGMWVDWLEPGLPGDTTGWNVRATNLLVTSVNKTTGVVVLEAVTGYSTIVDTTNLTPSGTAQQKADAYATLANDQIVNAGALTLSGTSSAGISSYNEILGLHALIDDGTSTFNDTAGTGRGCYRGKAFQGITDRTGIPQLCSKVYSNFDGSNAVDDWTLETVLKPIRDIDYGTGGGKVTALYGCPDIVAALDRRAWEEMNAMVTVNDNKITGGHYTKELVTSTGRRVPVIPMEGLAPNSIYGVCESDFQVIMPNNIGFVNPYVPGGNGDAFFKSPGARNLTYEAWVRCELQLAAKRCDNSFRIDGLETTT